MRIALVNYRYYVSGGPERYLFNIKDVLERKGHEVVPFSIKSSKNVPSPYEEDFLDTVDDQTYFAQSKKTLRVVLKYIDYQISNLKNCKIKHLNIHYIVHLL